MAWFDWIGKLAGKGAGREPGGLADYFDDCLRPGSAHVFAGAPGSGKTVALKMLATGALERGVSVLALTLGMREWMDASALAAQGGAQLRHWMAGQEGNMGRAGPLDRVGWAKGAPVFSVMEGFREKARSEAHWCGGFARALQGMDEGMPWLVIADECDALMDPGWGWAEYFARRGFALALGTQALGSQWDWSRAGSIWHFRTPGARPLPESAGLGDASRLLMELPAGRCARWKAGDSGFAGPVVSDLGPAWNAWREKSARARAALGGGREAMPEWPLYADLEKAELEKGIAAGAAGREKAGSL